MRSFLLGENSWERGDGNFVNWVFFPCVFSSTKRGVDAVFNWVFLGWGRSVSMFFVSPEIEFL